jgi:hypothetical protein
MLAGMGSKTLARALAKFSIAVFVLLHKFKFGLA